jgi:myo-inositol-1(or 4)-monophosphatase
MKLPKKEAERLLALAVKATDEVERFLRANPESTKVMSQQGRDIKILGDHAAEKILVRVLKDESPFVILSEESGIISNSSHEYRWIIDPIDGSYNFNRGIPVCCTSVALWNADSPVLGVIRDLSRPEVFSGIVGVGAWVNGQKVTVSHIDEKSNGVICAGLPVSADLSSSYFTRLSERLREYKKVRFFGSAALSVAYVGSGRAEVYYEEGIALWDVAAGLAIVEAAGGKFQIRPKSKEYTLEVIASNGRMANELDP